MVGHPSLRRIFANSVFFPKSRSQLIAILKAGVKNADQDTIMMDLKWSHSEKMIARRAFDIALNRELASLIEQARQRANRISGTAK